MFESIASVYDYIEKALEWDMPAICITNHGNVASWLTTKQKTNKAGLKYIHAVEAYVTNDNDETEKKTRDNYHLVLIAKNWEGAKEINRLVSNAFDRNSNHYHHKPRMYFDELKETTDNIIILTGCLGSALNGNRESGDTEKLKLWEDFFIENKHRVFLEVQPHIDDTQKEYNKYLLDLAERSGMGIIATNDVHNLNPERSAVAKKIKNSKGIVFDTDDSFETTFKHRDEMTEFFVNQGVLSSEQIEEALDNTMTVANMVEDFEVDTSIRYPHIFNQQKQTVGKTDVSKFRDTPFEDSLDLFRQLIVMGYKERGIDKKPLEEQLRYKRQVAHELPVYVKTGSIDYMLLEYSLKKEARDFMVNPNKSIRPGYARGSAGGSLIAYLINVTEVDPIRDDLVFERFMSEDRVGLPDIDSDWYDNDKDDVVGYLIDRDDVNCAVIMTKGTFAEKGAIKAVGKSLGYSAQEMDGLSKEFDAHDGLVTDSMRERYPELFYDVDLAVGSVANFSRHAGGVLVSSENIKEIVGLQTLGDDNRWVTQLDMDEISYLNLVKLDVLGVDNIGLLNDTILMAGLPYLTPDSPEVDHEDDAVWDSIRDDNTGIFQFESPRAGKILTDILSEENIARVKAVKPDIRRIDLMSLASAAQRPSGNSYVEEVTNGIFKDNGHEALNSFLAETLGYLVFQEQQSEFLVRFAGFKKTEADTVRKGISKKKPEIMDREVPKILPAFVEKMVNEHGDTEEHAREIAQDFIQIFMDSVNYGFNKSHSIAYAWIAYYTGWLRHYYPLDFLATALNIWQKKPKEVVFLAYADKHNIEIMPPKFGKSKGSYVGNKEDGKIYQGTAHIKGGNASVGEVLYTLKDYQYKTFTDLVIDVVENARVMKKFDKEDPAEMFDMSVQDLYRYNSIDYIKELDKKIKANPEYITYTKNPLGVNKTKMDGLIRLNFFDCFGQNKKLQQVYEYVSKNYDPSNKTFANKQKKYLACLEYEASLEDERFSILEQCEFELFYTGRVITSSDAIPAKYAFVTKIENVGKTRTTANVFIINKGVSTQIKVGSKLYKNVTFEVGDLIEVLEKEVKAKEGYVGGVWTKSSTDRELWIKQMKMIRRSKMTDGKKEKK